ncbi:hypothetical protein [Saccharothrix hoggarensis]|uniref:SPP1 gp7 family phage head morphogenesis protein n=1 Tax=Saccharothrix hoggarensis TaxID=913853 RepID=A0ABW3QMF8_9PSEU
MDELSAQARAAYASGWAASGGPMTDRVRAGCLAAVELACRNHLDPDVFETTMRLGQLEGVWAAVYERREQLYVDHTAHALATWQELVWTTVDIGGAVLAFRRRINLASEAAADDEDDLVAEAVAAALLLLTSVLADRSDSRYVALLAALTEALKNAAAEGVVTAMALAAEQIGIVGLDLDLVFADAYADVADPSDDARVLLEQIVTATAADLARLLTRLTRSGADHDEMLAEVDAYLADNEPRGLRTQVDVGIGAALTRAATGWYTAHGVRSVDFVTVGGAQVCVHCMDEESKNPHLISDVLHPPIHPFCRCTLVPTSPIRLLDVSRYLTGGTDV